MLKRISDRKSASTYKWHAVIRIFVLVQQKDQVGYGFVEKISDKSLGIVGCECRDEYDHCPADKEILVRPELKDFLCGGHKAVSYKLGRVNMKLGEVKTMFVTSSPCTRRL